MAARKPKPDLTLVSNNTPAETATPPAETSPTYYRVKPDGEQGGEVGLFIGTLAGLMRLEFEGGAVMSYQASDLEPVDAPEATTPPTLTEEQQLHIRALWHDGRVVAAINLVQQLLGLDMDGAKAKAIEVSQLGPPPEGYTLPSEQTEAPRSLEDQVIHPGEPLPRPAIQRDNDLQPEAPAPEPPTGIRSLGVKTIEMQVDLTPEEWAARAGELAQTEETIGLEELRQKGVRSALKATMDEMKADRHRLACAVRERKESRTVEVREEIDHDLGEMRTVEVATGRILTRAPIRGEHAQLTLADVKKPPASGDAEGEEEGEGDGEGDPSDPDSDEHDDSEE